MHDFQLTLASYSFHNPARIYNELQETLVPVVKEFYRFLTKAGYFSYEQAEEMIEQFFYSFKQHITNETDKLQIIAMTTLACGLYKRALKYEAYSFRQNRFLTFFNELFQYCYPALKRLVMNKDSFYTWYTDFLFQQLQVSKPSSPFEKLAATWLLCEENEAILIRHANHLLAYAAKDKLFAIKLASLLFLQGNDGAQSLRLLKENKELIHHCDLIDHFLIMKQKQEYYMMKHWFQLFFPAERPKHHTALGKLYEEMLLETGSEQEKLFLVWKNWLNQPSFSSYMEKMSRSDAQEKKRIVCYLLPKLRSKLYHPQVEAIYYLIITHERLFHEGIDSLFQQKNEATLLTAEIHQFLSAIEKQQPELLLPFYHQHIERLIAKKSKKHYFEAVVYIEKLKNIYLHLNKRQTFSAYLAVLKKRFKSYRAFIQELKTIDH